MEGSLVDHSDDLGSVIRHYRGMGKHSPFQPHPSSTTTKLKLTNLSLLLPNMFTEVNIVNAPCTLRLKLLPHSQMASAPAAATQTNLCTSTVLAVNNFCFTQEMCIGLCDMYSHVAQLSRPTPTFFHVSTRACRPSAFIASHRDAPWKKAAMGDDHG